MTLELSMTMTMVAVLVIGVCFAERVHTALEPVADVLEGLTVGRGRRAIRDLLDPLPAIESGRRSEARCGPESHLQQSSGLSGSGHASAHSVDASKRSSRRRGSCAELQRLFLTEPPTFSC